MAAVRPNVIVLDLTIPDGDGPSIVGRLRARGQELPPVVVVSGSPDAQEIATRIGAAAWFAKPIDLAALAAAIMELAGSPSGRARQVGSGEPVNTG